MNKIKSKNTQEIFLYSQGRKKAAPNGRNTSIVMYTYTDAERL